MRDDIDTLIRDADLGGDYARDLHRGGYGGDYARDDHRSGAGARGDFYGSAPRGYRGLGPKNYRRSDERIAEDVNERLTDHSDIDATEIEVSVENGEVTLRGSVDSRRAKRLAEDIAERCFGVVDVHNQLRLSAPIGKASE